ncbi:ATM interactor isoform X2 [Ambystoma mexicanum]|uniref:ATM interactor isoform X2 n=1 Tax=Ambystoma mexicanum TaxID=8296 RepID=UPI0037E6FD2A
MGIHWYYRPSWPGVSLSTHLRKPIPLMLNRTWDPHCCCRAPPVKKRKMEELMHTSKTSNNFSKVFSHGLSHIDCAQKLECSAISPLLSIAGSSGPYIIEQALEQPKHAQRFLLPKPSVWLVQLPVMEFARLPTTSAADSLANIGVIAGSGQGSVSSPINLAPRLMMKCSENAKSLVLKGTLPSSRMVPSNSSLECIDGAVQANLDNPLSSDVVDGLGHMRCKNRIASVNAQTDLSCISQILVPAGPSNYSESSCSQTDLSFSAQTLLPISIEIQTLGSNYKGSSSTATQTDILGEAVLSSGVINRETQTNATVTSPDNQEHMDQALICNEMFNMVSSSYTVSTQTSLSQETLVAGNIDQRFLHSDIDGNLINGTMKPQTNLSKDSLIDASVGPTFLETNDVVGLSSHRIKPEQFINFSGQNEVMPQQTMTDNQTQTMDLLNDLENIFSGNLSNHSLDGRGLLSEASTGGEMHLTSGSAQHAGIDFDIEEFFSASNIQTQTDETELGNINAESLDIETQTDFFFSDGSTLRGNASFLAMFDTQTQTDLNLFLDQNAHLPLGNILNQASFSVSTDSSDNETQTDMTSAGKAIAITSLENQVQLNSAETQTIDSCLDTLGSLFLTSNETQTAMDDFLLADVAWNTMESQFSSVETQTCKELLSLFQTSVNLED